MPGSEVRYFEWYVPFKTFNLNGPLPYAVGFTFGYNDLDGNGQKATQHRMERFFKTLSRYLIAIGCRCYIATRKYGALVKAVADYLGVRPTAISAMVRTGKQLAGK